MTLCATSSVYAIAFGVPKPIRYNERVYALAPDKLHVKLSGKFVIFSCHEGARTDHAFVVHERRLSPLDQARDPDQEDGTDERHDD